MSSPRRSKARFGQAPLDMDELRKRREARIQPGADVPAGLTLSEPGLVKLQHTIGNQALRRLLQGSRPAGDYASLQRQPKDSPNDKRETDSSASVLATIELENAGKIRGDSQITGHEGKIECLSVNTGSTPKRRSRETDSDETRGTITLVKYVDSTSPLLMNAAAKGDPLKTGKFEMIRRDAEGEITVYHTLEFASGFISGLQTSGSDQGGKPLETVIFEFHVTPKK